MGEKDDVQVDHSHGIRGFAAGKRCQEMLRITRWVSSVGAYWVKLTICDLELTITKHSHSTPLIQLISLNALWKIRCADPVRIDSIYKELGISGIVQSIYASFASMNDLQLSELMAMWKREYIQPFDGGLFDNLLASSRKALAAVNENELHDAAKSLSKMKNGEGFWEPEVYPVVAPLLHTLAKYLL